MGNLCLKQNTKQIFVDEAIYCCCFLLYGMDKHKNKTKSNDISTYTSQQSFRHSFVLLKSFCVIKPPVFV